MEVVGPQDDAGSKQLPPITDVTLAHAPGTGTGSEQQPSFDWEGELEIWETLWVKNAKDLSQWSVLSHFATSADARDVLLESQVMLGDWEGLKKLRLPAMSSSAVPSPLASFSPSDPHTPPRIALQIKMYDAMLTLVDRYPDPGQTTADATQMALAQWQALPVASFGAASHRTLLGAFHQLVELEGRTWISNHKTNPVHTS